MYERHLLFKEPTNENQKIWRYLDITKLLDLINSSSLYFTRSDCFKDVFEGSFTKLSVDSRTRYYELLSKQYPDASYGTPEENATYYKELKTEIAANCWHMNDHESAAMWSLYLKSQDGIAIQSTYNRLVDCFEETDIDVMIGIVKYIDYDKAFINFADTFSPFLHKWKSFEHENEIRCIVWQPDFSEDAAYNLRSGGVKIKIDLIALIEKIYVSPDSPKWLSDLLQDIVKKLGFDFPIINSRLSQLPLF